MEYKKVSPFKEKFLNYVLKSKNILLSTHLSPDDDAFSSMVSLKYFLSKKYPNKKIIMVVSSDLSSRYSSFYGYKEIIKNKDITEYINKFDLFIGTDASEFHRFSKYPEILKNSPFPKIFIDHHKTLSSNTDLILKRNTATSAAEIIYDLIHDSINIDQTLAELLILGILGDTGSLTFVRPDQRRIFKIFQDLLKRTPIDIQEFKSRYSKISPEVFKIFQEFVANNQYMHIKGWPKFQVTFLSREYLETNKIDDSLVSEAADIFVDQYLRLIEGYPWGFLVKPRTSDNSCTYSLRSLPGSVNVRLLIEQLNLGGGHDRASGGKLINPDGSPVTVDKAISTITDWMKNHPPILS